MNPVFLFFKNNKKVILYVIGLIVLLFAIKKVVQYIKAKSRGRTNLVNPAIGGELPEDWDPSQIVERFKDKFIGLSGNLEDKNDVLRDMYYLNQNQMIQAHNYWNENYSTQTTLWSEWGSIYDVINDEWQPIIVTGDTVNYFPLMKQRLIDWNLTQAD